ncbi:MAG: choice-of-anchor B family protein [Gemmatimonadota bacterium]|nr:choice-of-anchor B family protein [Gemmatimonadota bacterium]
MRSSMNSRFISAGPGLAAAILVSVSAVVPPPAAGQDLFGSSVGISGREVIVVKPAFGRGPATVYVFREADGEWTLVEELWSEGTAERGENFSRSLAVSGAEIAVGSGDPGVITGAYAFTRSADGWRESSPIPLAAADDAEGQTAVSMQTVMAILQPPQRVVAMDADAALVAVSAAGTRVVAFSRGADGSWTAVGDLAPSELGSSDGFGAAMDLRGSLAAVGAPRHGGSGAVFLFERTRAGAWIEAGKLTHEDLGTGGMFGGSVTFSPGGELIVGAPATSGSRGAVVAFRRNGAGGWTGRRLDPPTRATPGSTFGSAVAATDTELWVGAPGADNGRGRVDRFTRESAGAAWTPAGSLADPSLEGRAGMGASVALSGDRGVIGSPGADGGSGRAAIYVRDGENWSGATWVDAGVEYVEVTGDEVRCDADAAAGFDCHDVDLQAFLPLSSIGGGPGERVSDAWGWTDTQTGREYALVGRTRGAVFIDVTDPTAPVYLGELPANPSGARDLKVYNDHLFFTGDGAGAHGLMIFDLTRLRDVSSPPLTFEADLKWDGIGSAHNLIIDTDAGTAFTVSTSGSGQTCGGGLLMIDIRQPLAPEFAGCFTDTEGLIFPGRTHDAQCIVYDGPDPDYQGRELCFASNETALRIVDVTDKANPQPISAAAYPGVAYIHQGWLTEDRRYFYLDDELDELVGTTDRTKTIVWDVTDLDDPVVVGEYYGPNASTDHNLYIVGDRMYQANYQAGLRVVDISDPENPREVGYFDTTPYGADPPGFNGAWTAFPFFESGIVLVTSMHEGVFLLKPRREELVP